MHSIRASEFRLFQYWYPLITLIRIPLKYCSRVWYSGRRRTAEWNCLARRIVAFVTVLSSYHYHEYTGLLFLPIWPKQEHATGPRAKGTEIFLLTGWRGSIEPVKPLTQARLCTTTHHICGFIFVCILAYLTNKRVAWRSCCLNCEMFTAQTHSLY